MLYACKHVFSLSWRQQEKWLKLSDNGKGNEIFAIEERTTRLVNDISITTKQQQ